MNEITRVRREAGRKRLLEALEANHWNLAQVSGVLGLGYGSAPTLRAIKDCGLTAEYEAAKASGLIKRGGGKAKTTSAGFTNGCEHHRKTNAREELQVVWCEPVGFERAENESGTVFFKCVFAPTKQSEWLRETREQVVAASIPILEKYGFRPDDVDMVLRPEIVATIRWYEFLRSQFGLKRAREIEEGRAVLAEASWEHFKQSMLAVSYEKSE